jgi:protein-arginine kinase activator protein McsA
LKKSCEEKLDNELIFQQFQEIEEKVDHLLGRCRAYEQQNQQLTEKVKQLEEALQQKTEAEGVYQEEKSLIRARIDSLLTRLQPVLEETDQ